MTNDQPPIRLLLVDDHAIVREGVRALCEDEPGMDVVAEAGSGIEALAALKRHAVDVAIVDLKMPGMSAAQLVAQMREAAPLCNIIIFTSYADDQALIDVTQAGAIGYLLKDVQRQDLLAAIRAVASGQPWLHQSMHAQVVALLRRKPAVDRYAVLSPRERSVLRLLGQGMSNRQIAAALALTEGTVKGYVSSLLRKLDLTQRTQAALLVAREPVSD
jgi:DNA-binding NarL/FixJ family response regulator